MALFAEVLKAVQLALTWASPARIQALLEGLVEEQIISEGYSKSLNLLRLTEGITPAVCKLKSDDLMNFQGSVNQTRSESEWPVGEHGCTGSRSKRHPLYKNEVTHKNNMELIQELRWETVTDQHYLYHKGSSAPIISHHGCDLEFGNKIPELLISAELMQKQVSDSESLDEGNSEEWLEQVEEVARRIAVPLWQHWDRGWRMLLPLVPFRADGCGASEAQSPVLNMETQSELVNECKALDLYGNNLMCTDLSSTLDADGPPGGLCFSVDDSVASMRLDADDCDASEAGRKISPYQACAAGSSNTSDGWIEGNMDVCWVDGTTETTQDMLSLKGDVQCDTDVGFREDITPLFSPWTEVKHTDKQDPSMPLGIIDSVAHVLRTAYCTEMCSTIGETDFYGNKADEERIDAHWGAMMQEVDQDPLFCPDFGELPDLSEYFDDDDCLGKLVDHYLDNDVLFDESWLNCEDELRTCTDLPPMLTELLCPESHKQEPKDKITCNTNIKRKRHRAPQSRRCADEGTPRGPKRQRAAGQTKTKEAQTEATVITEGSEMVSAETADLSTSPPGILHLHSPIQFITISENPTYQVVRLSHLPIRLPLPNTAATPTYIFVPADSPPFKRQVPPLSPTGGALAPVQMSSSPPDSLSDSASKAMSPPCASPISLSYEISTCKESPLPRSATVPDIPQGVKDYIQEAKAHMSKKFQDMPSGLSLTSHYVDVEVSQSEIICSGKNTYKVLDKELVIMGDTDRQKSLLRPNKIFEGSNGDKPKCYILLLGNAGMGKTTLLRKLCLDWTRNCIPQFDFVFFLDGKALSLAEATFSLQTLLLNLSHFAPPCMDPDAVYAQILAAPKRVLIIFDGFGELRDYEILLQTQEKELIMSLQKDSKAQSYTVRQLYSAILQRVLLPGCTLLLSTRPKDTPTQLLRRTDRLLEVCGFTPSNIETYLSQYFTDPDHRAAALDCLKRCSYLHLLCWNPGLCQLVCSVLEQCKNLEDLPQTLTGLCHQVICLKMEKDRDAHRQMEVPVQETQISSSSHLTRKQKAPRAGVRTSSRSQRARGLKLEKEDFDGERTKSAGKEADRREERELLSQLSSLAWEGVKTNSSNLPKGRISAKLHAFGHRTGLFCSYYLRTRHHVSSGETEGGGRKSGEKTGYKDTENTDGGNEHILLWANPFLQSYLAGLHLCLSRTITERAFLQALPFQSGQRGRRRPQREELELTQHFAVGLLFHDRVELQKLHSYTERAFRCMVATKQALVIKHFEGLSHGDLSPAQVLQACHCVYDATTDSGRTQLVTHLAANLPEVLTFHRVSFKPSDVFAVQNVLEQGGAAGRRFCLDLENSGIQISGLKALVGLDNINTYRACIADVITLWEQLEQSGEEELLHRAVAKFKIHPLKATRVCHIEHLTKLVNIHEHKRISDSSRQSDSILAEGVPAVKELHKLELELGPEKGPLVLPKLWELLPGLHDLQHLDLEKSKIGDKGAEKLADALVALDSLEILNLSQNCIGDYGVKKLATTLRNLPRLHCLSLYSNVISDEGAESLASVLPRMASLTDLDVKYNKLTDVGAQILAASLKNCSNMKTLRMWNQCIPYGVFERLHQQDNRIHWQ